MPPRAWLVIAAALALTTSPALSGFPAARAGETTASTVAADFGRDVAPFLARHCYDCHGNGKRKGDLALDQKLDDEGIQERREIWENVIEMVRSGEMPPKPKSKPALGRGRAGDQGAGGGARPVRLRSDA